MNSRTILPHTGKSKRWMPDGLALLAILLAITLSWCIANSKWSFADWSLPSTYLEGRESDIIGMLANFRAAADGHYLPFGAKRIPELGAPETGVWADIPTVEEVPLYLTGVLARFVGVFAALNIKLLLAHLLAGATFYLVARYFRCSLPWAFLGGLTFGLAPFIFSESPHHSIVAYAWHIPLFLVVWKWIFESEGIAPGSRRFWVAVAIAFLTGLQNVYYTNIFCQLTLLGALLAFVKHRKLPHLLAVMGVIAAAAAAFFLMGLDTWIYQLQAGKNPGSIARPYHWLEVYSLKPIDFLIPSPAHQIDSFRNFAMAHNSRVAIVNEGSYLGLIGIGSLLWIFITSLTRAIRKPTEPMPAELWQILWILAVFCTGGLNSVAGALGFTVFRAGYRASIVIMAIALMFSAKKATALWPSGTRFPKFVVPLLACLVFIDQVPRPRSMDQRTQTQLAIDSDREFVQQIESLLPEGAMILQLPPMDFPESPVAGLTPYEHFRPYLYSTALRFSFGGVKGRMANPWMELFEKGELDRILAKARAQEFSAIFVNRRGFPDQGQSFFDALASRGLTDRIDSKMGDLVLIPLNNSQP